jgi:hypothetical protein
MIPPAMLSRQTVVGSAGGLPDAGP